MKNNPKPVSNANRQCYRYLLLVLAGIFGLLGACSEFIEAPLTDTLPELLSPGDRAETSDYVLYFRWEPTEDALDYRLQIATPTFDSVQFFLADTLISDTKYRQSLAPGKYQWRLRAQNGSTATAYVTRSFTVHQSDLSGQQVLPVSPAHMARTNASAVTFSWQPVFGVQRYTLQVDTNNFAGEDEEVVGEETTAATEVVFTLPREGSYQWRVRGSSDTSQTAWSDTRVVQYDNTPPGVPQLVSPDNQQQVSQPVRLVWNSSAGAARYLVYLYQADSTQYGQRPFPVTVTDTAYRFEGGKRQETILWRVRAVDQAGNTSDFSSWRRFILTN